MQTIKEFAHKNHITMTHKRVASNPYMEAGFSSDHYRCTLKHDGGKVSVVFSKG